MDLIGQITVIKRSGRDGATLDWSLDKSSLLIGRHEGNLSIDEDAQRRWSGHRSGGVRDLHSQTLSINKDGQLLGKHRRQRAETTLAASNHHVATSTYQNN